MPALVLASIIAIGGCSSGVVESASEPVSAEAFPADGAQPAELVKSWTAEGGSSMDLRADGTMTNVVRVSTGSGNSAGNESEGRWSVAQEHLFIELQGRTTKYEFEIKDGDLWMGRGKVRFRYKPD
ncbi:MAG: hypothetical protein MH204_06765 [Fimbriimonadaceae bacterium]|nr:hypothetical protein [Fimbriimonadaceae bacterium]